jgi:hypothetical protein
MVTQAEGSIDKRVTQTITKVTGFSCGETKLGEIFAPAKICGIPRDIQLLVTKVSF